MTVDEAAADMEKFGAPPELIDEMRQAHEEVAEFEVLPENWPTLRAWLAVQTQWRFGGMGTPVGLDYTAVDVAMRRLGMADDDGEIFAGLQVMEIAALGAVRD